MESNYKLWLPETVATIWSRHEIEKKACAEKRLELEAQAARLKQEASLLKRQEGNPAQQELNRRTAERLWKEATRKLSNRPVWNGRDFMERMRVDEIHKILAVGEILRQGRYEKDYSWDRPEKPVAWYRTLVRYAGKVFLVQECSFYIWMTDSVAQMNNAELELIAAPQR